MPAAARASAAAREASFGACVRKRWCSVSGSSSKPSSSESRASERRSMPWSWLRMPLRTARVRGVISGRSARCSASQHSACVKLRGGTAVPSPTMCIGATRREGDYRENRRCGAIMPSDRSEEAFVFDETDHGIEAVPGLEVGEHEGTVAAHALRVALHDFERVTYHRREIDLVDHEQVGLGDPGAALARNLVARGDVDHVEGEVGELRAEGRREVVAAGLDEDHLERGETAIETRHRLEVDPPVLANL